MIRGADVRRNSKIAPSNPNPEERKGSPPNSSKVKHGRRNTETDAQKLQNQVEVLENNFRGRRKSSVPNKGADSPENQVNNNKLRPQPIIYHQHHHHSVNDDGQVVHEHYHHQVDSKGNVIHTHHHHEQRNSEPNPETNAVAGVELDKMQHKLDAILGADPNEKDNEAKEELRKKVLDEVYEKHRMLSWGKEKQDDSIQPEAQTKHKKIVHAPRKTKSPDLLENVQMRQQRFTADVKDKHGGLSWGYEVEEDGHEHEDNPELGAANRRNTNGGAVSPRNTKVAKDHWKLIKADVFRGKKRRNSHEKGRRNTNTLLEKKVDENIGALKEELERIKHDLIPEKAQGKEHKIKGTEKRNKNSSSPPIEKQITDKRKKSLSAPAPFLNAIKASTSQESPKNKDLVTNEKKKLGKKKKNSAKFLLVKKKKQSKIGLTVKDDMKLALNSSHVEAPDEYEEDDDEDIGPQPPPYWEELLAGNKRFIRELKNVNDIGEAVESNPDLVTYLFKHPDFGRRVVHDPGLANDVVTHPKQFKEIARRGTIKSKHHKHPIIFLGHKYRFDDVRIHEEDRSLVISRSQLSLERDRQVYDSGHSLKALMGVERVYLKHDEIVYEGFLVFCDRKMHRYFFLDVDGKVIYHIRDYQFFTKDFFRSFDYGVLDQEGKEVLRMTRHFSLTSKQKVAVYCPPGNFIGYITQSWGLTTPSFFVKNLENHEFIEIRCCGRNWKSYWDSKDHQFEFIIKVVSTQHDMGVISTMWFEKQMETYSFEPHYGIHWNDEFTLNVKGLLLSSMLLVYLTYYNGRVEKRLYIERYNTPARPSYSVCEEDLENYEESKVEATHLIKTEEAKEVIEENDNRKVSECSNLNKSFSP